MFFSVIYSLGWDFKILLAIFMSPKCVVGENCFNFGFYWYSFYFIICTFDYGMTYYMVLDALHAMFYAAIDPLSAVSIILIFFSSTSGSQNAGLTTFPLASTTLSTP